jgi:hypothetical protein
MHRTSPPNPRIIEIGAVMDDLRKQRQIARNHLRLDLALRLCTRACIAIKIGLTDRAESQFAAALAIRADISATTA